MLEENVLKRLEHVEAVLAIQKLKHSYWHFNDTGLRGDEIAPLFTEDGIWSNEELGHYEGREAIRAFFNGASGAIPFCAHVGMNEIIDIDGDTATAKWRCLLPCTLVEDGKEVSRVILIDYRDDFARIDGRWFIKKLDILFNFNVEYPGGWVGEAKVRKSPD
jgi:hypothetical protein